MTDRVMKNEKTSAKVSRIAGKNLKRLQKIKQTTDFMPDVIHCAGLPLCTVAEFEAVNASALTQAEDKPKQVKAAKARR